MMDNDLATGDIHLSETYSSADNVEAIGFQAEEDIQQRKWFNADMKASKHGGLSKVECAVTESAFDTEHTELCTVHFHTIRMRMENREDVKKQFFLSLDLEGQFNQGTLMKTRHKANNSWS